MKLLLATKNRDKVKEISKALKSLDEKINVLSLHDFPDMPDVIEDGKTLEENSLKKAKEIFEFSGITTLADDTGLEVEHLEGAPGVYSARFAGEDCSYDDNNRKMLHEMKGVAPEKRKACFRTVITLFGDDIYESCEGRLDGYIIDEHRGNDGFGYDPIFKPVDSDRTLAEYSIEEKNEISHRGRAVKAMIEILKNKYI